MEQLPDYTLVPGEVAHKGKTSFTNMILFADPYPFYVHIVYIVYSIHKGTSTIDVYII